MGLKTKEEYIESIRALKPTVYMFGEKLTTSVVDNPRLRAGIEATGATYEMAEMPENRDLFITTSPLINEPVNRFTLPPASIPDLVARVKINRKLANYVGTCHQRCTGLDCLSTLAIVTYDIDKKYGTHYYDNFTEFLKYMQKNDLTANAGVTDVKGDRSLAPHAQVDKDMFLRVVEKREDGIVVRGAKAHQRVPFPRTRSSCCNPGHGQGDGDYSVAFAIPSDTPG
jgi:4-hydroxybutyryl-CoA dehydratase/vinylacetyl-CoA-Delta-isomerase